MSWIGTGSVATSTTATSGTGIAGMAVTLADYARLIGYAECAFWGVLHDDDADYQCRRVWSYAERYEIERQLLLAQNLIEEQLGYYLVPTWTTEERHPFRTSLRARHGHVIAGGVRSSTAIETGITLSYATDPVAVTIDLGGCDVGNVVFYHAGTEIAVQPSEVAEDEGLGTATYSFPWCRLVAPDYMVNPENGWDYNDVAEWGATELDAYCVANDTSTQGVMIWRREGANLCVGSPGCSCLTCNDDQETACIYVRNARRGMVDLVRANYADETWTRASLCRCPDWVELNYLSGLGSVPRALADALVRLAHANMPDEPCGCDVTQRLWARDRNVPAVLTAERINCPWGLSDGAWSAWKTANLKALKLGSVL